MSLRVASWTERMVVITLADFGAETVKTSIQRTEQLFLGYWLQRHGLSDADKQEVVDACHRLENEGLLRRPNGGAPDNPKTAWELTSDGVAEASELWSVFAQAM